MVAVVPFITSYITDKISGGVLDKIYEHVIQRWSKWRAQKFLEKFCSEINQLLNAKNDEELIKQIDKIVKDEIKSELLFEAYRRVSLSKSKTIGPRVVAIIIARLITNEETPTDEDELMLSASENLGDEELLSFARFLHEHIGKAENLDKYGNLKIEWCDEVFDSNWTREDEVSISPLNLTESIGVWAFKLKSLGILEDSTTEKNWRYSEDSERHIDEPGEARRVTWYISINRAFFIFADLIDRCV